MTKRTAEKTYKVTKYLPYFDKVFKVKETDVANSDNDRLFRFIDGDDVIEFRREDFDEALFCKTVSFLYIDGDTVKGPFKQYGTYYFKPEWLRSITNIRINGKKKKDRKIGQPNRLFYVFSGGEINLLQVDAKKTSVETEGGEDWQCFYNEIVSIVVAFT